MNEFEKINGEDKRTKDKNNKTTKVQTPTKNKSSKKLVKAKKVSTSKSPKKRNDDTPTKNKSLKKSVKAKKVLTPKSTKKRNDDTTTKTKSKKKSVQSKATPKKADLKKVKEKVPKVFCCKLNHKDFRSYKAESDKKWFGEKQRFEKSECFICKKIIGTNNETNTFVPSTSKPAYICVNSTKNCIKCLCHFCCAKSMIDDKSDKTNNNRRSKRNRT